MEIIDRALDRSNTNADFVSKVIFFFGLAIAVSGLGVFLGFAYLLPVFAANPGTMWLLFIVELALIFTSRMWSTKQPLNYLLFSLFALLTGLTLVPLLGTFLVTHGAGILIKAFAATTMMFAGAALYGITTQRNLLGLGGFLFMGLLGMIIIGVVGIFLPWGSTFEMIFAGFGVILFSIFTAFDMQRLRYYPSDRYIDAALGLYLDIFNLFIFVLRLIGGTSRS